MITKRNGNGQTECRGCKEKGKFALNWDSFLYNFNNKPYCFDCLMETLENLQTKNQQLKSTLEEIREYIKHNIRHEYRNGRDNEFYLELNQKKLNGLLQIIDKSKK